MSELGAGSTEREAGGASGVFDFSRQAHRVAFDLLATEPIAWLTTVRPDGAPAAVPVWFLWDDGDLVVLSRPTARKVRNLEANPHSLLHLNAVADESPVVVIRGTATLEHDAAAAWLEDGGRDFGGKYARELAELYHWTSAEMAAQFSTVIRIAPASLLAWTAEELQE
ncbi:pyridoxamine 5'-phosphate oxidase family protein [Agromyces seonyuensis]|uniref:Pyridoxamine 5'-phosphate oxidase N-terminal domain-containing protein n=1 Tax=Agromyces seonyuensis TaxID=2662446 RepID=A0A6I4P1Y1_9MICO|nr:pyridoxamine 5'-phosphate oxidase family protein [Agromyces seonyuensis]MWC00422.1 hypothetical protein [Agromyces seonyuensis]